MKKICFSEKYGLHDAVLAGRKTHTRRLIPKSILDKVEAFHHEYYEATLDSLSWKDLLEQYFNIEQRGKLPFKVGEVVAVAQRYGSILDELEDPKNFCCMEHWESANGKRAHYASFIHHPGFTNKMFVNAEEMPHQICIKKMWFERLRDISDEDCMAEGVSMEKHGFFIKGIHTESHICESCVIFDGEAYKLFSSPREAYAALIDKISGKGTWDSNPYVFAYEFERVK